MIQLYEELKKDVLKIITDYEVKILSIINKIKTLQDVNNFNENEIHELINEYSEKIQDLINECLERIYALIAKFVRTYYPDVEFNEENVASLTWNEDGISLEERVASYITASVLEMIILLKEGKDVTQIKRLLEFQIVRILDTEAFLVVNKILENKLKKVSKYFQVLSDNCCGGCENISEQGILPIYKLEKTPPYHPNCQCIIIYYTEYPKNI